MRKKHGGFFFLYSRNQITKLTGVRFKKNEQFHYFLFPFQEAKRINKYHDMFIAVLRGTVTFVDLYRNTLIWEVVLISTYFSFQPRRLALSVPGWNFPFANLTLRGLV